MRVFLTGASGYLGSNLLTFLLRNPTITFLTCLVRKEKDFETLQNLSTQTARVHLLLGDITAPETYAQSLEGIDVVIHAAAMRGIELCNSYPNEAIRVNVYGTMQLLEASLRAGVHRFLFCSSQAVYSTSSPSPYREDAAPHPTTVYGITKYRGELLVQEAAEQGMEFLILRFSRLYGWGTSMRDDELPHRFARYALESHLLPVYNDGEDVLDLVHIRDAVSATLFFLQSCRTIWNTTYNIGGGQPISVLQLAQLYARLCRDLGLPTPEIRVYPAPLGRKPTIFHLDITKAAKVGWSPTISLREGITELLLAYGRKKGKITAHSKAHA